MNIRDKWNKKHIERMKVMKEPAPNPRLKYLSNVFTGGTALDLACGLGGNSLFLARLNFKVDAIDISDVAINNLLKKAYENNLTIQPQVSDLTDLRNLKWANSPYDLIIITYYLDRSLFPFVKTNIKENGYFFMETYYQSPLTENQGVSNQYKLQPKELISEFKDWKVLFFEENEQEGRQTVFCQKSFSCCPSWSVSSRTN